MQNTGKSIETAWNVDLQNMKRQVPGRAGADGPEGGNRKAGNSKVQDGLGTCRRTERRHSMQEYISRLKKSLLKRKHTAIGFIASAGYIYFFSWLYIFSRLLIKTNKIYPQGSP